MSLPISPVSTAIAAAGLAVDAAQMIGKSLGFDAVLQGGEKADSAGNVNSAGDSSQTDLISLDSLKSKLGEAARATLSAVGIPTNPAIELGVQFGDRLTVESDHGQAARIEAALNADSSLRKLAGQLSAKVAQQRSGQSNIRVSVPGSADLTSGPATGNIPSMSGGYANWLAD